MGWLCMCRSAAVFLRKPRFDLRFANCGSTAAPAAVCYFRGMDDGRVVDLDRLAVEFAVV